MYWNLPSEGPPMNDPDLYSTKTLIVINVVSFLMLCGMTAIVGGA